MLGKRLMIVSVLLAGWASTGCRTWCEHHYPCPQPCYAAPAATYYPQPACCQPCAPAAAPAAYAPAPSYSSPGACCPPAH